MYMKNIWTGESEEYAVIKPGDEFYPQSLLHLYDPPKELYCRGRLELLKSYKKAAVVGSRKNSLYGKWAAENISGLLSENGVTVISGLAMGIDAIAHRSALDGDGGTIAVLGCGIDICYPAINRKLKEDIEQKGLVISEYPPNMKAQRWTFPRRNRIIAALSELVVVAEAGLGSGALITAEIAAEQSKKIMAVPGNINNPHSIGANKLIYDGAIPVIAVSDVLEVMGIYDIKIREKGMSLGEAEKEIYNMIEKGGEISTEELCDYLGYQPGYVNGIVTILEMKGMVNTSLGKVFVAK